MKLSRERTVTELKNAVANIQEFKFMKNVNNLEDFRTVITSSNYWADSFAISLLNIYLILKLSYYQKVLIKRETIKNQTQQRI